MKKKMVLTFEQYTINIQRNLLTFNLQLFFKQYTFNIHLKPAVEVEKLQLTNMLREILSKKHSQRHTLSSTRNSAPFGKLFSMNDLHYFESRILFRMENMHIWMHLPSTSLHIVKTPQSNSGTVSITYPCVLIEVLQDLPAPLLVLLILGKSVQIEEAFHGLWPQKVVPVGNLQDNTKSVSFHILKQTYVSQLPRVGRTESYFSAHLYIYILCAAVMHVEMSYLWAQTCLHLGIHLVAGLNQLFCQLHMISRKAIMCPQCQCARQETNQMVLKETRQEKKGAT